MSEESGGKPEKVTSGGRDRNRNRDRNVPTKFEGKIPEQKNAIFDLQTRESDAFNVSLRNVAEHIARTVSNGGEFITALNPEDLGFDLLVEPADPAANATAVAMEKWKYRVKEFRDAERDRKKASKAACAIILSQCSESMRDRMKTCSTWRSIEAQLDVMELVKLIRTAMFSGRSSKKTTVTFLEAETDLFSFRQIKRMANSKHSEAFKAKAEMHEHLGGEPGMNRMRVNAQIRENGDDPGAATDRQRSRAEKQCKEEHLANLFIKNACRSRFTDLNAQLKRAQARGNDECPKTLEAALEMLDTEQEMLKAIGKHNTHCSADEGGLSCATEADDNDGPSPGRGGRNNQGRGGRGGRGRGRGRGSGGRGSDAKRGNQRNTNECANLTSEDDANQTNEEKQGTFEDSDNNGSEAVNDPCMHCCNVVKAQRLNIDLLRSTVIDSASASDIIGCDFLLHDMHDAEFPLNVNTISGRTKISQLGCLGSHPLPVWCNPKSGVNILSLNNLQSFCRCTMDTGKENCIHVHLKDGSKIKFAATEKGLHVYQLKEGESIDTLWSLLTTTDLEAQTHWVDTSTAETDATHVVDTAESRADNCTKRDYERAMRARKLENIVMRPGGRKFIDVCIPHLRDSPVTKGDARAANDMFGPNLGAVKGKTARRPNPHVETGVDPVPPKILSMHRKLAIAVDMMFVNKVPFLITTSRNLKFGTAEALPNRRISTVVARIRAAFAPCTHRGFRITSILCDNEFEPARPWFPILNTCAAGEHVPDIERCMRTAKDSTRSTYRMLQFSHIPRLVLVHLVKNAVFWANAFPATDGVSSEHSPRHIMTGREVTCKHHVRLPFGSHVQTHEDHTNDMNQRTVGAMCLGPAGNQQGGHWFMCLTSGARLIRHRWTACPMLREVIDRTNQIGMRQRMPTKLTHANRCGNEIEDTLEDIDYDTDDDAEWEPDSDDETDETVDSTDESSQDDSSDDEDDDSDDDDDGPDNGTGSNLHRPHNDDEFFGHDDREIRVGNGDSGAPTVTRREQRHRRQQQTTVPTARPQQIRPSPRSGTGAPNATRPGNPRSATGPTPEDQSNGDPAAATDDAPTEQAEQDQPESEEGSDEESQAPSIEQLVEEIEQQLDEHLAEIRNDDDDQPTLSEEFDEAERLGREAANDQQQRPTRRRQTKRDNDFACMNRAFNPNNNDTHFANLVRCMHHIGPHAMLTVMTEQSVNDMATLLTEQMTAKKGLKVFGEDGANAIKKELQQLICRKVMHGKRAEELTHEQKKAALRYLMFLKQKHSGQVKGRGCADGRKQRTCKTKEETSSPTMHIESLFISCLIDAIEGRKVITLDIPGAFVQADIDEIIHVKLVGEIVELLLRVDPSHEQFVTYENGKIVICAELDKALHGALQAALLFWQKLTKFLSKLGFKLNPHDRCVMNKTINNKQMTIGWHVDDLKMSHVEDEVLEDIAAKLDAEFGKEAPLTVTRGKIHDCLGMKTDCSVKGQVQFSMHDHVDRLVDGTPEELLKGPCATAAANHLFNVNENATKLDPATAILYHHLTAQLLHLSKWTRPDLLPTVSFLCTRAREPDEDDWKKLGRCVRFLASTRDDCLTLSAETPAKLCWWIDASFAVHSDMRSHTGATMTMGKGSPASISSKQKINTQSSTEAEVVGVNDAMCPVLWVRHFLEAQGCTITDNIVCQDNQSAMLLENNGRRSCSKNTRHMETRHFFATDNIERNKLSIKHCPADDMVADCFTKPLQGSKFRHFRQRIMNLPINPNDAHRASQECVGTPLATEPDRPARRDVSPPDMNGSGGTSPSKALLTRGDGSDVVRVQKLRRQARSHLAAAKRSLLQ